jgi:hypothetical protein
MLLFAESYFTGITILVQARINLRINTKVEDSRKFGRQDVLTVLNLL